MSKAFIVFSGYNQRAVIALLRTLEKHDIRYGIIATPESDTIFLSDYADRAVKRHRQKLVIEDIVASIKQSIETIGHAEEYVIAPSTEALNRFLLDNRQTIESLGCVLPLVDKSLYESISDKQSFTTLCKDSGILVPSEYSVDSISFPCVAKPRTYKTDTALPHIPVLIDDPDGFSRFQEQYNVEDFYYQQFVGGNSFYLLYYRHSDGTIDKLSQQNFVQQPAGKSMIAAATATVHTEAVSQQYEGLLGDVNFRGLIMIEIKYFEGRHYMIEANPRMWGPSQLFVDAGLNLFESLLWDYNFIPKRIFTPKEGLCRYFWSGGIRHEEGSLRELAYHNYSSDLFANEMSLWSAQDIYNRSDTKRIYQHELEA